METSCATLRGPQVSLIALHISDAGRVFVVVLVLTAVAVLVRARYRLRGTTLVAPTTWAIFSLSSMAAVIGADARWALPDVEHWHYLAAVTTLTPFVALLGAKRPQNRAWQVIVAALLGLLWLQSVRAMLIDPSLAPLPHAAWHWFLAIVLAAEVANYLPTRYAPAALFVFAGQICLLSGQLPIVREWLHPAPGIGWGLLATGVLLATALASRPRRTPSPQDQAWLNFRDAFGALWALRVAERINAAAKAQNWPVRLGWRGFRPAEGGAGEVSIVAHLQAAIEQALAGVLWRFVAEKQPNPPNGHLPA